MHTHTCELINKSHRPDEKTITGVACYPNESACVDVSASLQRGGHACAKIKHVIIKSKHLNCRQAYRLTQHLCPLVFAVWHRLLRQIKCANKRALDLSFLWKGFVPHMYTMCTHKSAGSHTKTFVTATRSVKTRGLRGKTKTNELLFFGHHDLYSRS